MGWELGDLICRFGVGDDAVHASVALGLVGLDVVQPSVDSGLDLFLRQAADRRSTGRLCPRRSRQDTKVGAGITEFLIGVVSPVGEKIPDSGEIFGVLGSLHDTFPLRVEDRGHLGRKTCSDRDGVCCR